MKTILLLPHFLWLALALLYAGPIQGQNPFITTWKTDNPGTSNSTSVTIYASPFYSYNYDVDWENDGTFDDLGVTGSITHDYGAAGTYSIAIQGDFPYFIFEGSVFSPSGDAQKLLSIDQWGDIAWQVMAGSFNHAVNMVYNASDAPDLSGVTGIQYMFYNATSFDGNINSWEVDNVTNMSAMFNGASAFNQPLDGWKVGNVTIMNFMFFNASAFNQPLDGWQVGNVTNMNSMFRGSAFNQPLDGWEVGNVTSMSGMFFNASAFNQPLDGWEVGNVTNMSYMFSGASAFNQPLDGWKVGNVTNMSSMFFNASAFDQPLDGWEVGNVTDMSGMFAGASAFNQPLDGWEVGNVTNMSFMFFNASAFNQPLDGWEVGNVTNISQMFFNASAFNQPLDGWEVDNVTDMSSMFAGASAFNQPLDGWEVGNVTDMSGMFAGASAFNQPLDGWQVGNVTNMGAMFAGASAFNQPLDGWEVDNVTNMSGMFSGSGLNTDNYDNTLIGWAAQSVQNNVPLGAAGLTYCAGEAARDKLINDFGWAITGDSKDCSCTDTDGDGLCDVDDPDDDNDGCLDVDDPDPLVVNVEIPENGIDDNCNGQVDEIIYCTPSFNDPCTYMHITNVSLAEIDNSTDCSTGGYADFTSFSASLSAGASYTASISGTGCCGQYATVYVDWNVDGDFEDEGEVAASMIALASDGTPGMANFTVPSDAEGAYTMRVVSDWTTTYSSANSCNTDYGEVEDYSLTVTSASCPDNDNDNICDADDPDDDNDGCLDEDDPDPLVASTDADGDGLGDDCDDCNNALAGTACDDGDDCTINDAYDADCNCAGTFADADNDSVCDADDQCPGFDDLADADGDGTPDGCDDNDCDNALAGTACDDGDDCTINDAYDADCNCAGTFADADNDSICDADDQCPGFDDLADADGDGTPDGCDDNDCDNALAGTACDDGDGCTINDAYDADCNCAGTFADADNDSICDADDQCPGFDDLADADGDGTPDGCDDCNNALAGTACDDGDGCTINDAYDADCNCAGTFADADNDSVCDADDQCPGFDDLADADNDGTPDGCDDCNNALAGTACDDGDGCTINDAYDADCNCAGTFADADNDSVCDADDQCPGFDDLADADNDGTPDGCDDCNNNLPPVGCLPGNTITLGNDGTYRLSEADVLDLAQATDGCTYQLDGIQPRYFDCDDAGRTVNVRVRVKDESDNLSQCELAITVVAESNLPEGWSSQDVGDDGIGNAYRFQNCEGTITIEGGATNQESQEDNIAFAYLPLCGDGTVTARVQNINRYGYGGPAIRETLEPGSKMAALFSVGSPILRWEQRAQQGANKSVYANYAPFPNYLRLKRSGNTVYAYTSRDGNYFRLFRRVYLPMDNCVYLGLAAFSNQLGRSGEVAFSDIQVTGNIQGRSGSTPLPVVDNGTTADTPVDMRLFPNPTRETVSLQLERPLEQPAALILRGLYGQVLEQRRLEAGQELLEWNVARWPAGMYTLQVVIDGQPSRSLRLIKTE